MASSAPSATVSTWSVPWIENRGFEQLKQPSKEMPQPSESTPSHGSTLEYAHSLDNARKAHEELYSYSLWSTLYDGTSQTHKLAKQNQFLNQVIKGNTAFAPKAYFTYLCNLYVIHKAIERAQENIETTYGSGYFVFPDLYRSERLLNDIKLWSIFTSYAPKFSHLDIHSDEFVANVKSIVEPSTYTFVSHIEQTSKSNPLFIIGTLYTLYGTILSGGQIVKEGVEKSFVYCIENDVKEGEHVPLAVSIREEIKLDPSALQRYAGRSVSCFKFPDFIRFPEFKQTWHANLDELPQKLQLTTEARDEFANNLIGEANFAMKSVLEFIEDMEKNVKNY